VDESGKAEGEDRGVNESGLDKISCKALNCCVNSVVGWRDSVVTDD